ncbi:MAG: helix-turn-helix transcriptional regulator [Pseudomonadota bacterium]
MNMDLLLMPQSEDFRKQLGGRIKSLRKQKRWSQKELAAKVNIRFQQLNKYESGLNIPPAEMLITLADALQITVDYLLTGNPADETPLGSSRLFRRFQELESFDQGDQDTVIKVIDAVITKHRVEGAMLPVDKETN